MNGQAERPGDRDDVQDEEINTGASDASAQQEGAPEAASADPDARLAAAEAKAAENWDRYLRAAAELDNVRKRAVRDVENARKYALENFSRDLLAVRDSLEMGIDAAQNAGESADAGALLEGSEATLKLLSQTMERFGVEMLDPIGEPFDPEFHEAMTMQPSADAEPGSILTVVQKGFTLNGRLLRPARVVVAAEPAASGGPE